MVSYKVILERNDEKGYYTATVPAGNIALSIDNCL